MTFPTMAIVTLALLAAACAPQPEAPVAEAEPMPDPEEANRILDEAGFLGLLADAGLEVG